MRVGKLSGRKSSPLGKKHTWAWLCFEAGLMLEFTRGVLICLSKGHSLVCSFRYGLELHLKGAQTFASCLFVSEMYNFRERVLGLMSLQKKKQQPLRSFFC